MNLEEIYSQHPLSERTILARLTRHGVSLDALTEWNLAVDPETDITDQNHSGGVQAVMELGLAADVTSRAVVADVGAGLGGSARVLAHAFGCRVICIDRDAHRCADAISLNERVRLSNLVSVRKQDALLEQPGLDEMDVLWGQAAWAHFPSPGRFLDVWLPTLGRGGRVAMADAYLHRAIASEDDEQLVAALQNSWSAKLVPISAWVDALEQRRCRIVHLQERTEESVASFSRLVRAASRWPAGDVTEDEREGWHRALRAFSTGLLAAYQLVATR
jgi:protein-L-isoaspartate O-methyltransferase